MNKSRVIGISGVARAGKDTFASILGAKLKMAGKTVDRFAFADALKQDCDAFCKEKLGVSAFTQVPEEKALIRPLLVWYGDAMRKRTNGRYWVNIIDQKVKASKADYSIVTDVRYDFYDNDEISWVKDECNGIVVHVSKYTLGERVDDGSHTPVKMFVTPANSHEQENDPKVKAKANYLVEWEHVDGLSSEQLTNDSSLISHVNKFISVSGLT